MDGITVIGIFVGSWITFGYLADLIFGSKILLKKKQEIMKSGDNLKRAFFHDLSHCLKFLFYGPLAFSKEYREKICPKCFG